MRKFLTTPRFDKRMQSFLKHRPDLAINVHRIMDDLVSGCNKLNFKIHKLSGILNGCFAASVSYEYRIIFVLRPEIICFIDIGTHDEVYR